VLNKKNIFYTSSETISFKFHVDKNIQKLLPAMLRLHRDREGILFYANHTDSVFCEPYREVGVIVKVRSLYGTGYHFLWAVVSNNTAMVLGREVLGVSKMMAGIEWRLEDGKFRSVISHDHTDIAYLSASFSQEAVSSYKILGNRMYNVGGLGSFLIFQPIYSYLSKEEILDCKKVDLDKDYLQLPDFLGPIANSGGSLFGGQYIKSNVFCTNILLPCGITGPSWFLKNYNIRYIL
jgi:acetoacetate decarboxylase